MRAAPFCALTLLLFSCGAPSGRPPLDDSVLVEVMVDLHLADARAASFADVPLSIRDSVLARHGLDSSAYAGAMDYYVRHPRAYAALYERVVDRLHAETIPVARPDDATAPPADTVDP